MRLWPSTRFAAGARVVTAAGIGLTLLIARPATEQVPRDLPPAPEPRIVRIDPPAADARSRPLALADGEPLSFRQEPPLLLARDDHGVRLTDFTVAGDVARVRFDRVNPETRAEESETWERQRTETIGGRLVSVFQPSWRAESIQVQLARSAVGLDRPLLYLGSYRGAADAPSVERYVYLRVGTSLARPVEIVRVDDTVQYSSHVVNLVIPRFGDQRLSTDFELTAVTRKFYEHFEDTYEVLAVVPQAAHPASYGGYHAVVQNAVEGIGMATVRRFAAYGSAGALLGVEVYPQAWLTTNAVSNHELTHTWSHNFDWTRITSFPRPSDVGAHAPLMTGGESMVSAVLFPNLRAVRRGDGAAIIERVTGLARQHPLDFYAMGLLEASQVPEWEVFEQQDQFGDESNPKPGDAIAGGARRVSINDVMAAHGPRRGPVLSSLSRATVLVSRDTLASPEEMAYWNFFSARLEDPTGSGVPGYDGQPSFDLTTNRRIDLRTDVRPNSHPKLGQPHDVDPAAFGATDCRGVEFTKPPRARVRVGERFTVAGRVTARDRNYFDEVLVRLWPSTGDQTRVERAYGELNGNTFSVDLELREGREGQYLTELFLFWPDSGSQYARCTLTPTVVLPLAR